MEIASPSNIESAFPGDTEEEAAGAGAAPLLADDDDDDDDDEEEEDEADDVPVLKSNFISVDIATRLESKKLVLLTLLRFAPLK